MRIEEQRLDWLFFSEEITIVLERYEGNYPLELRVYAEDGQLAFSGYFHSQVLSFGRRFLPDGQYAYLVRAGNLEVSRGELAVP